MKRKIWYVCLISLLSVFLLAACGKKEEKNNPNYNSENYLSGKHYALMDIADFGQVYLELDADAAPITVTNFVDLAKKGFYDGTTFHRIMDGFVVQGGAPRTDWSEEVHKIKGEFSDNGVDNPLVHTEGVLSMARSSDSYNSASSQFFIMVGDYPHLDGQYAAFGHVTDGYEIVQKIAADTKPTDSNGTIEPEEQPVIESVVILD
jgi:peptidyl-prolyl cis-trans isomerase B (cyclophilin B)